MKTEIVLAFCLCLFIISLSNKLSAQDPQDTVKTDLSPNYLIIKNDKTQFIGPILFQDAREVIIKTDKLGEIVIPKHEIKEMRELNADEVKEGKYLGEELFATRYFLTTNGLSVKKGESYIQWNLFGPDFQFAVSDNVGLGIMTSWVGIPIVGTAKYSAKLGNKTSFALGTLLGTGSWAQPDFGIALPFAAITFGDRKHNINLSTGYGLVFYSTNTYNPVSGIDEKEKSRDGRFLISVAGMTKVSNTISLIFDSFIMPPGPYKDYTEWIWNDNTQNYKRITTTERTPMLMVLVPGIRWQSQPNSAFQFGFTGALFEGEFLPVPIPMLQWYRKL